MTQEQIAALSNVDLLQEFGQGAFLGWPDGEGDYNALRSEILSRMDTGIAYREEVPNHPSEYQR